MSGKLLYSGLIIVATIIYLVFLVHLIIFPILKENYLKFELFDYRYCIVIPVVIGLFIASTGFIYLGIDFIKEYFKILNQKNNKDQAKYK